MDDSIWAQQQSAWTSDQLGEVSPRTVTLTCEPFRDAATLRHFVDTVKALPGVQEVRIVALERETLTLELRCPDQVPLVEALQSLANPKIEVKGSEEALLCVVLRG